MSQSVQSKHLCSSKYVRQSLRISIVTQECGRNNTIGRKHKYVLEVAQDRFWSVSRVTTCSFAKQFINKITQRKFSVQWQVPNAHWSSSKQYWLFTLTQAKIWRRSSILIPFPLVLQQHSIIPFREISFLLGPEVQVLHPCPRDQDKLTKRKYGPF